MNPGEPGTNPERQRTRRTRTNPEYFHVPDSNSLVFSAYLHKTEPGISTTRKRYVPGFVSDCFCSTRKPGRTRPPTGVTNLPPGLARGVLFLTAPEFAGTGSHWFPEPGNRVPVEVAP